MLSCFRFVKLNAVNEFLVQTIRFTAMPARDRIPRAFLTPRGTFVEHFVEHSVKHS